MVNVDTIPDTVDTPSFSSPRSVLSATHTSLRHRLPPRHLADPLIDRFFDQVHSIFWVFPRDQFLRQLDKTYVYSSLDHYPGTPYDDHDRREIEVPSWLCCLFTALALGCRTDDGGSLKPSELFYHAKRLSRCVVEDESIQSIQALLLMVFPSGCGLTLEFISCEYGFEEFGMDLPW